MNSHLHAIVAIILAAGFAVALNIVVLAIFWDAAYGPRPGLSANATQVLIGWGGGVVGVLGSYLGYRHGYRAGQQADKGG